jgi:hypothetical protein
VILFIILYYILYLHVTFKLLLPIYLFSSVVSLGTQEIFKLLPHTFVDPSRLPELFGVVSFKCHICS